MSDLFASLPSFPKESRDRLPPARRDWGQFLRPANVLAIALGLLLGTGWTWPLTLIFFFVLDFFPPFVAICGLVLFTPILVFLYSGLRPDQREW